MTSKDRPRNVRLHVGALSQALIDDIGDLERRFGKIGKIVEPFEVLHKPIADYHYGFVTMQLTDAQFEKLRKNFNGVQFKGAKLIVNEATPRYQVRMRRDIARDDEKAKARKEAAYIARRRQERIQRASTNPFERDLVIRNAIERKTPRKTDLRKATMRSLVKKKHGGKELKVVRVGTKRRLWGYNKNKAEDELSYEFMRGKWRDARGHILERDALKAAKEVEDGVTQNFADLEPEDKHHVDVVADEGSRNVGLLASLNFDGPVDMEEDSEFESGSDYEMDGAGVVDAEPSASKSEIYAAALPVEGEKEAAVVNFDEDYYGEPEDKPVPKEFVDDEGEDASEGASEGDVFHDAVDDENIDTEFMPTFGNAPAVAAAEEEAAGKNTTEQLRSLLNPETGAHFSFTGEALESEAEADDNAVAAAAPAAPAPVKDVGMFFAHFDSPFLVAQTQINRLVAQPIEGYEEWFFEKRGEMNRLLRQRRREALRRHKKHVMI